MSTSERVKRWRKATKDRIVESMGGCCSICGYSKCTSALVLHHLDPSQKDFGLGGIRANPKSWSTIVTELKKCIMLCQNCYSEVHEGISVIPDGYTGFNILYEKYELDRTK
jgi:predicted molibdopterin-dependent oxidoreductase YjgC